MKKLFVLAVGLLPSCRLKVLLLRLLGWKIGENSSVGPGVYWNLSSVSLGEASRIGPFNVLRDVRLVRLGAHSVLGQWNWISAAKPLTTAPGTGQFTMGTHSAVTSRHYVDCSGSVTIGNYSTIAGVRTTFITHGINWTLAAQQVRAIEIGSYCLISSNVCVAPGTRVPDAVVVGMGSTISGSRGRSRGLWVQPRAEYIRSVDGNYFSREVGFVREEQAE